MAISFIVMLIRHDHPLPTEAVKLLTHSLVHDALVVRKVLSATVNVIIFSTFLYVNPFSTDKLCHVLYCTVICTQKRFRVVLLLQMAISAMKYILQQQKRKYKKVPVDILKEGESSGEIKIAGKNVIPPLVAGVSSLSSDLPPGQKKENAW